MYSCRRCLCTCTVYRRGEPPVCVPASENDLPRLLERKKRIIPQNSLLAARFRGISSRISSSDTYEDYRRGTWEATFSKVVLKFNRLLIDRSRVTKKLPFYSIFQLFNSRVFSLFCKFFKYQDIICLANHILGTYETAMINQLSLKRARNFEPDVHSFSIIFY